MLTSRIDQMNTVRGSEQYLDIPLVVDINDRPLLTIRGLAPHAIVTPSNVDNANDAVNNSKDAVNKSKKAVDKGKARDPRERPSSKTAVQYPDDPDLDSDGLEDAINNVASDSNASEAEDEVSALPIIKRRCLNVSSSKAPLSASKQGKLPRFSTITRMLIQSSWWWC